MCWEIRTDGINEWKVVYSIAGGIGTIIPNDGPSPEVVNDLFIGYGEELWQYPFCPQ